MLYRIRSIYDANVRTTRSHSHLDEDAFNQAIAAEVRALMARHRKNQADVARHLGIKPNAASFRWQGKTPWSTAELLLLCDWLDVDAAEVMAAAKAAALEQTAARSGTVTERDLAMAEELRAEAERRQITNAELQRRSRVAKNTLGGIMDGTRAADPSELGAICTALGITIYELFERAEARLAEESRGDDQQASGG